jgi:hypothetical protein
VPISLGDLISRLIHIWQVPHALNFSVLRCMPDQMYYSVKDVRTVDDANLTVCSLQPHLQPHL